LPILSTLRSAAHRAARWAYDATDATNRRRAPRSVLQSEDSALTPTRRRTLISATRDLRRNFEIAAWAIRLHLDFVASHAFESHTGNDAFDKGLEEFVARWGRKGNFEATGRHSRRRCMRLAEAHRVCDGDVFFQRLRSGLVAPIEGDRIRTPGGTNRADYSHGIRTNAAGKPLGYALHNRTGSSGFTFARELSAQYVEQLAYFDRFDQGRGISPLAPAVNRLRDSYECLDYALVKAKVSQLFGLALHRDDDEAIGDVETADDADGNPDKSAQTIDFGRGPFQLDLGIDETAEILESKTPSAEFTNYVELSIALGLKALDIPAIFWDESRTNFSGARGAVILYELSARDKQAEIQELLDRLTYWRLQMAILDGAFELPRGWTLQDLVWEWLPQKMPWINPLQEVKADVEAINNCLTSPQRVLKRQKIDFDDVVTEVREAREKINSLPPAPGAKPKQKEAE